MTGATGTGAAAAFSWAAPSAVGSGDEGGSSPGWDAGQPKTADDCVARTGVPAFNPGLTESLVQAASLVDGLCKGLPHPDWPAEPWDALRRWMLVMLEAAAPAPAGAGKGRRVRLALSA